MGGLLTEKVALISKVWFGRKGVGYQQGWVTDANKVGGWWEELGVRPKPTPTKMGGLLTEKVALISKLSIRVGYGRKQSWWVVGGIGCAS